MQILPIEKKFQRNSSLDYRLGLIANYQMVAKELCVYAYTTGNPVWFKEFHATFSNEPNNFQML